MKKLKIMLLSLALFAVVGGALAFKARYSRNWCVVQTTDACDAAGLKCPIASQQFDINTNATDKPFCTTLVPQGGCKATTPCSTDPKVSLFIE